MKRGVLSKPDSFYDAFTRKADGDPESTHYCAGCGHGNIHKLVGEALDDLGVRERTIFISPVGCAVFAYYYFHCGNIQAAHGRAPAVATAVKRARPEALVVAYQGDGDLAAIGGNNILHAANRGENITVLFVNNAIYGMTGGQMAPTTLLEQHTTTTPLGRSAANEGYPLRVCELLATLQAPVYLERTSVHDTKHIARTRAAIRRALEAQLAGRGFSLVEILSPCPTGWGLTPGDARAFVAEEMIRTFPLGTYRDDRARVVPPADPRARPEDPVRVAGAGPDVAQEPRVAPPGTHRIVIAGFGGQGVLLLGTLLANAGMQQNRQVSWLPSYGPEMRGGTANCHVVLSDRRIGSPFVPAPDLLVAFNEPSVQKFGPRVRPGGIAIYDSSFVTTPFVRDDIAVWAIPLSRIADELGSARSANMVALGAVNALCDLFPRALLERQVDALGKESLRESNLRAIEAGAQAVRRAR